MSPIEMSSDPDPVIDEIINTLMGELKQIDLENVDPILVEKAQAKAESFREKLENDIDSINKDNFDHIDEMTELREILDNVRTLSNVLPPLMAGRIKWIIKNLEEVRRENNAESVRFVNEEY